MAGVSLALQMELSGPVGMSETSGQDILDRIYKTPVDRRSERIAWAMQAGGDV